MLINAVETTTFTYAVGRTLIGQSWQVTWRRLSSSPLLMFCLVFSLTMGVGVGLATTNLGTLSRYRMPLVPFFAALVLITSVPVHHAKPAPRPVRPVPPRPLRIRGTPIRPIPEPNK
jgi:hypothetical protein